MPVSRRVLAQSTYMISLGTDAAKELAGDWNEELTARSWKLKPVWYLSKVESLRKCAASHYWNRMEKAELAAREIGLAHTCD